MLKRLLLVLALVVGAFALAPSQSQATPLGVSAQADVQNIGKAEQVRWRRYRHYGFYRPRRFYYRPYYRPRRHFYRRYYGPRFYRRGFYF